MRKRRKEGIGKFLVSNETEILQMTVQIKLVVVQVSEKINTDFQFPF